MMKLLYEGGPIFTYPMTLIFLVNIVLIARNLAYLYGKKFSSTEQAMNWINPIRYIGIFLLTVGILGQIIGLYSAFEAIEAGAIEVTPQKIAAGIRVSSITTMLGLFYFIISFFSWLLLKIRASKF